MEQNILKTGVITNKTVYCDSVEQSVDTDFSLPDYCNDIARILKCKAVPRVSLKTVSGKTVTIDGTVNITVFYSDEDGRINSYNQTYPFEKTKETDSDLDDANVKVTAKCEYMNCRAVTSRKIDIHGAIGIKICAKKKNETEIISDIDDCRIETLRGTAPQTSPTGDAEKYLIIEEDVELSSEKDGERIFCYDAVSTVKEAKIINGKVLIKGEMDLKLKYLSDEKIKSFNTSIPFSQVLDIETVGEGCEVSAKSEVGFVEITPRTDSSGNFNIVSVNAKVLVSAKTYCNNDIPVILDAYSRKNLCEIEKENIKFSRLVKNINETFNCKKNISVDSGSISSVLDNWCDVKIGESGFDGNYMFINGSVTVSFIIEDSDGVASYFEKPIEFTYKYPIEGEDLRCEPEITISSCSYTIISTDSIEVRVDLNIKGAIYKDCEMSIITEISSGEETNDRGQNSAMIVYFASENENLWDIAKKYLASISEIKAINGISDETFKEEKTILIPLS